MADDEAKILEREEPPRHPGVSVLGPSHPLEGRVVRQERKLTAQKMAAAPGLPILWPEPLSRLSRSSSRLASASC